MIHVHKLIVSRGVWGQPGNFCILDSLRLLLVHSQVQFKAQLKELASNDMFKTLSQFKQNRYNLSLNPCYDSFSRKKLFSSETY